MIGLLDTGFSNLSAYKNVLNYVGKKHQIISSGGYEVTDFEAILLPGVSSFGPLSQELSKRDLGLFVKKAYHCNIKIIGTCSGMQILFNKSEESPGAEGLGIIKGEVNRFPSMDHSSTNIGWKKSSSGEYFFVHSYYCKSKEDFDYLEHSSFNGISFMSEFKKNSVYGFQYHPEKSGINGVEKIKTALES